MAAEVGGWFASCSTLWQPHLLVSAMLTSSLVYPKKGSENAENCHSRQPHCDLTPPPRGTTAYIRINLIPPEIRATGLHFATDSRGSIFIQIFVMGSERIFSATECVSAVQGHLRSLILAPIERACATSC